MSTVDIKVPALGESITEATLNSWSVAVGDTVEMDQTLCELDSDKASVEVPAEQAGKIVELMVEEGDDIEVGAVLCRIDTSAGGKAEQSKAQSSAQEKTGKTEESPAQDKTQVNASADAERGASADHKAQNSPYSQDYPSPAAAKLMREEGLSPENVVASGRAGRITKQDVLKASQKSTEPGQDSATKAKSQPAQSSPSSSAADQHEGRGTERQKMSRLRQTIARRLVEAKNETAMLTTFNEVDMSAVMALRSKYKVAFKEKYGVGLGFMSFFTAASCLALIDFPAVNAQLDEKEIIFHDYCDVGVAVSSDKGLVVPVLRNAESLNFDEIEREIIELATRARDGKLTIEEMQGGTFTITNGGVFGSMLSTPIINVPQCAILGLHNIVERPVAIKGQVEIRPIMYLALSYDHRLIDGKEAVQFLVRIKDLIEDPARLMLGV